MRGKNYHLDSNRVFRKIHLVFEKEFRISKRIATSSLSSKRHANFALIEVPYCFCDIRKITGAKQHYFVTAYRLHFPSSSKNNLLSSLEKAGNIYLHVSTRTRRNCTVVGSRHQPALL